MAIAHTELGRKMIPVYHETCINHVIEQKINFEKIVNDSKDPAYEIHIKCLKGHDLCETNPLFCKDYDLTNEPFEWKLQFMRDIANWNWELDYEK